MGGRVGEWAGTDSAKLKTTLAANAAYETAPPSPQLRHVRPAPCRAMLIVLLAMQAAPQTGGQAILPSADLNAFDLAKAKPKSTDNDCDVDNPGGDIVVCARRKMMDIDISRMPDFTEKPVRTVVDLAGGAKAGVGTTAREVGGFTSKAIMAKVKIAF